MTKLLAGLKYSICDLQAHPDALDQLVTWQHDQWRGARRLSDTACQQDKKAREAALKLHLSPLDVIPRTFILLVSAESENTTQVSGMVSLVRYGTAKSHLQKLWLTNLYVLPECRNRGLGSELLHHAEAYARRLDQAQVHLYTADQKNFYMRNGFVLKNQSEIAGGRVDILEKTLTEVEC